MKLSFKTILPILLIFTLLVLFAGCAITPSPGYTPGTITGIIAAPCCSTSADPVTEPQGVSPEYWCYDCKGDWSLQNGVEVILTYGEDEIATVFTNEDGEYTFTNVPPGKNYVITAFCPDYDDDRPLVKDVALEVVEGETYDAKITDCVSTSLGLVVDFLVTYSELGPEDIVLDGVIAGKPNFWGFPRFKKLVEEVCRASENCGNLSTDEDVQDALCKAAEEVGQIVLPDLDLGCTPGFAPGPGPEPSPCEGNATPTISSVLLDGNPLSVGLPVHIVVGTPYVVTVIASDPDGILGSLTYSATIDGNPVGTVASNVITVTPLVAGTFEVYVNVNDGCIPTPWGPITVIVDPLTVTASVPGGNGTALPATQGVDYGASASIAITPDTNYHLASITDNGTPMSIVGITNTYTINPVIVNHDVVFAFSVDRLTVTASVPGGNGTALPATQSVNYNASASIAIAPATGYHLASITDNSTSMDITGITNTYTIDPVIVNHTVVVTFIKPIVIDAGDLHANLGSGADKPYWDLHVWSTITNNLGQPFNGYMRIRSVQVETGITTWYPSQYGFEAGITIDPGKGRYPSATSDYWLMTDVATGSGKPKDVVVTIWIYDLNQDEVASTSENAV